MSSRTSRAGNFVKRLPDMKGCILVNFFVTMIHQGGTPAARDYCMNSSVPARFLSRSLSCLLALAAMIVGGRMIPVEVAAADKVNTGWLMAVSGAAISTPQFPGSETYSFVSLPPAIAASMAAADSFIAPDDSLSFALFGRDPDFSIGAVGRYGSDGSKSGAAALLPHTESEWGVEPGVFAEFWPDPNALRLRGELRMGAEGSVGMIGSVGADFVRRIGGLVFAAGPRLSISDDTYANSHSGIGPEGTPGASGVRSLGAAGLVRFVSRDQWSTALYANYDRRLNSPQMSETTGKTGGGASLSIGASFNYVFPIPRPSDLGE